MSLGAPPCANVGLSISSPVGVKLSLETSKAWVKTNGEYLMSNLTLARLSAERELGASLHHCGALYAKHCCEKILLQRQDRPSTGSVLAFQEPPSQALLVGMMGLAGEGLARLSDEQLIMAFDAST